MDDVLKAVPGAAELVEWFGVWPSFHDAEILHLHLDRSGNSELLVNTWRMRNETDEKGYYKLEKFVNVKFTMAGIRDLELADFSIQNVIMGLQIVAGAQGLRIMLNPCFGLAGWIECESLAITFEPSS